MLIFGIICIIVAIWGIIMCILTAKDGTDIAFILFSVLALLFVGIALCIGASNSEKQVCKRYEKFGADQTIVCMEYFQKEQNK